MIVYTARLRARAEITLHFGASAGRADSRRRDAGDAGSSSRSSNEADARPPLRLFGLRLADPLALLLTPHMLPGMAGPIGPDLVARA